VFEKNFQFSVLHTIRYGDGAGNTIEENSSIFSLGWQEGHPACKKWGDGGGGHWLVRMEWLPAGWSMCLPLLILPCSIKSRSSLLAQAHLGGPGKMATKQLWWCDVLHTIVNLCRVLVVSLPGNRIKFYLR